MTLQRFVRKLGELKDDSLTLGHVRTVTVVRLPFHLCTGDVSQIDDPDNSHVQVWLKNSVSIPHDVEPHQALITYEIFEIARLSPRDLLTDALIVNSQPELRDGEFESIKTGKVELTGPMSFSNPGFRLLNEVIGAHQMVRLGPCFSGITSWPRMLTEREMIDRVLVEVVLLVSPDHRIDKNDILRLSENIDRSHFNLDNGGIGDLRDYSSEEMTSVELAIRKIRNHAFYELKTNAIGAMLRGDSIVAIVLACAALEGAHGAFMRRTLRDRFPGNTSEFNKFLNGFLREQGFYSLVQLSVRILMEVNERPTEDELDRCLEGVTIRNAIMHAGIKGTGEYKIREYSQSEINDGYSGIMAVYRAFEAAIERREKQGNTGDAP